MAAVSGDGFPGRIRTLDVGDMHALLELSRDRGWKNGEAMWRLVLEVGDGFGINASDGGLAGAVILTRYSPGLAVIGMLLVASRHGRRGLGHQLVCHALAQVPDHLVYLHASLQGRPLYERLGFHVTGTVSRHIGVYQSAAPGISAGVRDPVPADRAEVLRLDRAVFGADRAAVLTALAATAGQVLVAEDHRGLVGHAAAWHDAGMLIIGPVVARDDTTAQALIHALAVGAREPVRLDLSSRFSGLSRWACGQGLVPSTPDPVMAYLGQQLPGARGQLYALVMPALG